MNIKLQHYLYLLKRHWRSAISPLCRLISWILWRLPYMSQWVCNLMHLTGNILIIFQMRFSNVFGITVNVRTKAIKWMTKSELFLLDACAEFSFLFGLITSILHLTFTCFSVTSIYKGKKVKSLAILKGKAGSETFKAFQSQ